MLEYVKKFEGYVYLILIVVLCGVIVFSVGELLVVLYNNLTLTSPYTLDNHELLNIFGFFLLVLIGIELLDTLLAYLRENVIHVEVVILVALIAIARKVILLEPEYSDSMMLIGIGVVVIGLAGAYFLIKKSNTLGTDTR